MNSRDAAALLMVAVRVMLYEEGFLRFRLSWTWKWPELAPREMKRRR